MLLVAVAAFAVLGSGLFEITTVQVDGRGVQRRPAFDAVVDELEGSNVLRVDTDAAERELERIPGSRTPGSRPTSRTGRAIEVREREPSIAYQGTDGQYRVLDRDGPGARRDRGAAGRVPRAVRHRLGAADLDPGADGAARLPGRRDARPGADPEIRARVVSISADAEATDLRMLFGRLRATRNIEVRFGAAQDLVDKLVRLQTVLTDPDPERVPTELIDVSGPDLNVR